MQSETSPIPIPGAGGTDIVRQSAPLARRGLEALQKSRGRVVQFPAEPIGTYSLQSGSPSYEQIEGDACGEVYVPSGWELGLNPRDAAAFHQLASLRPGDVDEISFISGDDFDLQILDGRSVAYLGHLAGLRRLSLSFLRLEDVDFEWLRYLHVLEDLELSNDPEQNGYGFTGAVIERLPMNAPLSRLALGNVSFIESDLERVSRYAQLKELAFWYERTDGSGFRKLESMSSLRELHVSGDGTDEDMAVLASLPCLKQLWLWDVPVTARILRHLAKAGRLSDLSLRNTNVRGRLEALADLPLEALTLSHTPLTDAVGPVLGQLWGLRYLDLSSTAITNRMLDFLAGLPHLLHLGVIDTDVSDGAVQQLCRMLPRLAVEVGEWDHRRALRGELADYG